jgi:hypothetical protein
VPIEDLAGGHDIEEFRAKRQSRLPAHAVTRSPTSARASSLRARGPQGGRGRQRRYARLDRADGRAR